MIIMKQDCAWHEALSLHGYNAMHIGASSALNAFMTQIHQQS